MAVGAPDPLRLLIEAVDSREPQTLRRQIQLCETPAPTGAEGARGLLMADWLRAAGCDLRTDEVGNVIGTRPGAGSGRIVLAAHLDSVFSADQRVVVACPGEPDPYGEGAVPPGEYHAPGIADDAAGLAALVTIAETLQEAGARAEAGIVFLATVGEEGRGDLRGARHFLANEGAGLNAFIAIDHPDPAVIVQRGVGSRRYSVEFLGPGGHAWGHFGRYNPALALAGAAHRLSALRLPPEPRTTLNVGVLEAGRAVNAIPERAGMEVDLRSESARHLEWLDKEFHAAMHAGHDEELARRPSAEAVLRLTRIGDRPAGETPADAPLVQLARAALQAEGLRPRLIGSSTDANAAMAAGIPAIALSWGGRSDNQHSIQEFFAPEGRDRSLRVILRLLMALAG